MRGERARLRIHQTFMIAIVVALAAWCTTATAVSDDIDAVIELTKAPTNIQLYPRDETNHGWVIVEGTVKPSDVREIQIRTLRDDQLWHEVTQTINSPQFSLRIPIEAGLYSYTVETSAVLTNGETQLVSQAHTLAAGDVYLIQGQSNAVAGDYYGEHLANQNQREWIRSFGTASTNPGDVPNDLEWHLADGEGFNGSGTVGAWGLRMAQQTIDTYGVPIGLLNGAVGGTPISYHLRDDNDHDDLYTNYGRLLYRCQAAGVAQHAKAVFWYQGESDTNTTLRDYYLMFRDLYRDWNEDYPAIEHIYVCQVREGCGSPTVALRDLMRRFGDAFPKVEVMSLTAAPGHDTCHFIYAGYHELGNRLSRLIARDFYGSDDVLEITPPNPRSASWTSGAKDEILITFRKPEDQLIVDDGAYLDFGLLVEEPWITVTSVEVAGPGELLVHLSGSSTAKGISYKGHMSDGPWVKNGRGVGLLAFRIRIE